MIPQSNIFKQKTKWVGSRHAVIRNILTLWLYLSLKNTWLPVIAVCFLCSHIILYSSSVNVRPISWENCCNTAYIPRRWVSSFLTAHQHIIGHSVPWRTTIIRRRQFAHYPFSRSWRPHLSFVASERLIYISLHRFINIESLSVSDWICGPSITSLENNRYTVHRRQHYT